MNRHERRALEALRFDWAPTPEDVWQPSPFHVDGLHADVLDGIAAGIRDAQRSTGGSPIGVAIQGQRGAGKTHLLGLVREAVQDAGGYFFLISPHDGDRFWDSVAVTMLEDLLRETAGRERQLTALLRRLCEQARVLGGVAAAVLGEVELTPRDLSSFVVALRRLAPQVGLACQDTARALVLYGCPEPGLLDIGYQYLLSMAEAEPGDRAAWGIHRTAKPPMMVVHDLSRLLALTGPCVIAVDQIDALVVQSMRMPTDRGAAADDGRDGLVLDQIAGGLMQLREVTRRTLPVVACLPESWMMIKDRAVNTVQDRFREALQLHRIPDAGIGRAIVEKRFGVRFAEVGFAPRYPTWPVLPAAFADAPDFTPRGLLQRVDAHIRACLRGGAVTELDRLIGEPAIVEPPPPPPVGDLAALDARFAELRRGAGAGVAAALDPQTEDTAMPALLAAGLTAWIVEQGDRAPAFAQDPPRGKRPALHARLRRTLDEYTEDEMHWAFRAVASGNARAVQVRVRDACAMAGIGATGAGAKRRLFLLRTDDWPTGPVTREVIAAFTAVGGVRLRIDPEDLATFAALQRLLAERDGNLQAWLLARRPASGTGLLRAAVGDGSPARPEPARGRAAVPDADAPAEAAATTGTAGVREPATARGPAPRGEAAPRPAVPPAGATPEPAAAAAARGRGGGPYLTLGVTAGGRQPVRVGLESLRKHTAIFAGSGSGKTVLIRRLVEECALQGVSAIVLDPNNDLARLGDPWPEPPAAWGPGDAARAADYLAHTDVVVWTPRREAGRPLSFRPLPDFRSVRDDPDEFAAAIDAAVAALAPRAKVNANTTKASRGQAVLHEALRFFARQGGTDLKSFVDLLGDLPAGVSALARADRIAAELAETLTAAMVIDPLFGGDGAPVDPGLLLNPAPGRRARVSVISFVGLPGDEQRQSFVNQLQLALFAWIREHPAGERPLGGLFVMDEAQTFAPSGTMTACTRSTLALASQARKYGLGLVFATQAPKGLHNAIPGNAATQFFGFLNSPAQIEAAREVARAKGSAVLDISRLTAGEFYAAAEGLPFEKIRTPLCLSYHPKSPLTAEEVIARAARTHAPRRPVPVG